MADNYVQFSDALELDNAAQVAWFQRQLAPNMLEQLRAYSLEHMGRKIKPPKWANGIVLAHHILSGDGDATLGYDIEGPDDKGRFSIVFYAEESGDPEAVATLVQAYLKKFAPTRCFGLCWAVTCSKPRIGEFGGGAVLVTATRIEYLSTFEWLDRKAAAFKQPPVPLALAPKEVGSIYCDGDDRFVVSLIATYDTRRDRIRTPKQALAAAIRLTTGENCPDTLWHVFDRKAQQLHQIRQQETT